MKRGLPMVALVVALGACRSAVAPSHSGGGTGGTSLAPTSSGAGPGESGGDSSGMTATPPACDPSFDSGLARGAVVWTQTFPTREVAKTLGITTSASGELFLAGSREAPAGAQDAWFLHLAADGTFANEVARDLSGRDEFEDVAMAPDGHAIVVGYEALSGLEIPVVYAIAPTGTLAWREPVELDGNPEVLGPRSRVAVSHQGRIVAGFNWWGRGIGGLALVELTTSGEHVRSFSLPSDAPVDLDLRDLGFDDSGVLYAGGSAGEGVGDLEWIGRWSSDGAFLGSWEHAKRGAKALEISPRQDGVVVLGADFAREGFPAYVRPSLRRYDGAGTELWVRVIDVEEVGDDILAASELAVDCLGQSIVYATHSPSGGGLNRWLFTFDDEGQEVERRQLELETNLGRFTPIISDITTDPFGNVILGMTASGSPGGVELLTLAR